MVGHGTSRAGEPGAAFADRDERVFLHGVSWEDYERIASLRGESAVPRLIYLDGVLELMCMDEPTQAAAVKALRIGAR
jgi:hypothetical protein